jgi:hypothetical protein
MAINWDLSLAARKAPANRRKKEETAMNRRQDARALETARR